MSALAVIQWVATLLASLTLAAVLLLADAPMWAVIGFWTIGFWTLQRPHR